MTPLLAVALSVIVPAVALLVARVAVAQIKRRTCADLHDVLREVATTKPDQVAPAIRAIMDSDPYPNDPQVSRRLTGRTGPRRESTAPR